MLKLCQLMPQSLRYLNQHPQPSTLAVTPDKVGQSSSDQFVVEDPSSLFTPAIQTC